MQSKQRWKRKDFLIKPLFSISDLYYFFKYSALFLFLAFFLFFNGFPFKSGLLFRPLFSSILVKHLGSELVPLRIEDRVLFPGHVLLLVPSGSRLSWLNLHGGLECVYREKLSNSSTWIGGDRVSRKVRLPVLSVDEYNGLQAIARCPLPPANYSTVVELRRRVIDRKDGEDDLTVKGREAQTWDTLAYAAELDGETALVFVKGLNLRPDRVLDPARFSCHFNLGDSKESGSYAFTTNAVTAAQEIVRCSLPLSLLKDPGKANGALVSVRRRAFNGRLRARATSFRPPVPSVAVIMPTNLKKQGKKKHELCVCTMLWNQAPSLREWVLYHAWLGVERWFIYDNNSDDDIEKVIEELEQENYNVSRHVWPWIKSQEAGFSHCILKARNECKWVAFMDVDEFFYFPFPTDHHVKTSALAYPGHSSLRTLVAKFSSSKMIGEIRTVCHSFGPSGLIVPPSQGVTVGYTCRLQSPERHKSIVRPDALHEALLNVVHHFRLKSGYRYLNLPQNTAVINHYKYQVWQTFRSKFFRRVATYVTDWHENQNEGSKDRAPGLGTEAIEPRNWRIQFCQVWDTGLRDSVTANLADPFSGLLPWEKSLN